MDTTNSPSPKPRRASGAAARAPRVKIDSLARVRREMARLFTEAKAGRRDVADASKLANILALIGRILEGAESDARIEALEKAVALEPRP